MIAIIMTSNIGLPYWSTLLAGTMCSIKIDPLKTYLPPFHNMQDLMKNLVVTMNKNGDAFQYLKRFSILSKI